jgi:predicted MPP superfamily phosphohydrolase
VRGFFFCLVLGLLLGDAAWWWRADRWLRGFQRGRGWGILWGRWVLGIFMGSVMGGLAGLVGMRWSGAFPESAFPSGWFALVYVWHLLVLPAVLLIWGAVGVSSVLWRGLFRWPWWPLRVGRSWGRTGGSGGSGGSPFQRLQGDCGEGGMSGSAGEEAFAGASSGGASNVGVFRGESDVVKGDAGEGWGGEGWGNRRDFLGAVAGMTPAGLALGVTGRSLGLLEDFRVRRLEVCLPGLPAGLEGFRIAHVSDLHVGRFTRGRVLERIVEVTNGLEADLVAFTGDLVNYSLEDLPAGLELLGALRAKLGVVAVEGNHDLLVDGNRFRRETSRVVPLLVDETLPLRERGVDLAVLGLGWGSDVRRLLERALPGGGVSSEGSGTFLANPTFPILLAHHPHVFDGAEGVALTLSGHTHGGQLMVTDRMGIGPMMFRYWSGLYRRRERALVVSNGVGNWFPVRTRAPAEVVEVVLRGAPRTGPVG